MNKNKNFLIVCLLVMVTAFFAVPNAAKAFEDPKKPKATNIHYYPSDSASLKDRTGIKSFTLDPYTYYNLSKDTSINPTQSDTIVLDNKTIKNIAKNYLFPKWSVIADSVFKDQASQLVTIKGSGLMKSDQTSSQSFDRHFNTGKAGVSGYNYNWAVGDLAYELRQEGTYTKGSVLKDELRREGIKAIGNLKDARTMMGQSLRNCSDDNDNTVDDFLGNSYQKTENEYRLPALDDDKTGSGFCNVVTCINQAAVNDYDYVTFGLCIYDFDVTPVAAKDLKYIEAAQKVDNGEKILMGTGGSGDPKWGVTFSNSSREGSKSYFKNATASEATQSAGLETSVTEESSVSKDETFEWGMEQTIGAEWNLGGFGLGDKSAMFPRVTLSASNSWHEMWSTTKTTSQTKSVTKTKNINTELTLPPDTIATINQNIDNKSVEEDYQQPVILNYKVALFAMSGDYYNGTCGGIKPSTYDKQWMSVIFDGSDDNKVSGCDALGGLYRSVTDGTSRYDTAKGKLKSWCDKGAFSKSEGINWNNVASNIASDSRGTRHIVSSETGKKATLEQMAKELPLIEKAHTLESKQQTSTASVDQILPLKPLKAVSLKNPQKAFSVTPGETFYLDNLELEATDTSNIEFYNFDDDWGQWYLLDDNGNVIKDDDEDGITTNGNVTLNTDDDLNSQWIKTSGNVDNQKIKWVLDENAKICSNDQPGGMTKEEIKALNDNNNTPAISLSAKDESKDLKEIAVTGEFKEPYINTDDEPYNLNSYFKAKAIDGTGVKSNVQIFWEGDGDDDFEVKENGDITFSKPGEYNVRPFCYDTVNGNKKKVTTKDNAFITVKAMDKARLNRISFRLPDDIDEEDTTLTNKNHSLGFDLDSYVRMYDQYDEDWTGEKPEIRFTVTDKNGNDTSDANIDHENMLTVTSAGRYKVTAKAYDSKGEELQISIDPINLVIDENDWLDQIIFNDPALSKDQLSIKEIDGEVRIDNLKNQLEYVDQNNHEWKGSKPRVEFYLADTTSNAEIKGDSFFAYAPGTYDIVAITADYEIDPISVTVYEKSENIIKTVDPDDLKIEDISADGDYENVEYDLMRSMDYTTRFNGKWNDKYPKPAVKFTLDESTPGATISDNNIFRTNKPGSYTIHVEPKKYSEYPDKSIDDIQVNVVLDRQIKYVLMDFRMIPSSERRLSDGVCVVSDLEQYVKYLDQFGNAFKKSELEKYKHELPKVTGFTFATDIPETQAMIDKSFDPSRSDYYYYLTAQSPGDYEVKPVYDEGSVGDDLSFVSGTLHILNKNEDDVVEGKVYSKIGSGEELPDEQTDRYNAAFLALDDLYSYASPTDYNGDAADPSSDRAKIAAIIDEAADSIVSTYNNDSVSDDDAALRYNQINEAAKKEIDKYKTTAQIAEDQAKAQHVSILIRALPDQPDPKSQSYIKDVISASEAFEALTDDQKALIDTKDKNKLEQAEESVKEEIRLDNAKKNAVSEVERTDLSVYDFKEREEVTDLIGKATNAINNAGSVDEVSMYLEFFMDSIDSVATKKDKELDKAAADLNAAKAVMAMVDALPEDPGADKDDAVKKVWDAYEALTDDQKGYFDAGYYNRLSKAKESVENVRDAIEWLHSFPQKLDISDEIMVVVTDYMFLELTDTEISHVYNIEVYDDSKAAMRVIKMISALKSPENITTADEERIRSARSAFDALTEAQKNRVSDVVKEKLSTTEKVLEMKKAGVENQDVIAVLELISKIPDKLQTKDEATIDEATTAYNKLDNDQRNAVIEATSKLAESTAAIPVVKKIERIPDKIGFADTDSVKNVKNELDNLEPVAAQQRIYQNLMNKLEDRVEVARVVELIYKIPDNPGLEDEDKVTEAANDYDDQPEYLHGYMADACITKLNNARQAIQDARSQAEIQDVISKINALTEESTAEEIQAARSDYDKLSDEQKESVTNYNKLVAAEEAVAQKELDDVKAAAVNDLNNIDTTKYSGEELNSANESIKAGKTLVGLSNSKEEVEFFKDLVNEAVSSLMTDEDKSIARINSAKENIAKIPENVTLEDKDIVNAARKAYDELTPEEQKQIDEKSVNKLKAAEESIAKASTDKDAADKVIKAINSIPDKAKAEDLPAIKAAQDAYNALSAEQKALVGKDAVEKLNNARKTAEKDKDVKDKAAADKVSEMINKLPADPTIDDEKQVTEAMNAFNALTDDQKALIPDAQRNKLVNADKKMELSKAKSNAKAELNSIDLSKYDEDGRAAVSKIISEAKKDIEKAATVSDVESIMNYVRNSIALVKTAKQKKAENIKTVKVNTKTVNAKAIDKAVKKAGGKAAYITKIVLGKKVKKIKKNSFTKYKKVRTLEIQSKKLKKKSVKKALKGSKIKTIKVKAGSKKVNKKYIKKYKKIFTKKNAGKKVKVK